MGYGTGPGLDGGGVGRRSAPSQVWVPGVHQRAGGPAIGRAARPGVDAGARAGGRPPQVRPPARVRDPVVCVGARGREPRGDVLGRAGAALGGGVVRVSLGGASGREGAGSGQDPGGRGWRRARGHGEGVHGRVVVGHGGVAGKRRRVRGASSALVLGGGHRRGRRGGSPDGGSDGVRHGGSPRASQWVHVGPGRPDVHDARRVHGDEGRESRAGHGAGAPNGRGGAVPAVRATAGGLRRGGRPTRGAWTSTRAATPS